MTARMRRVRAASAGVLLTALVTASGAQAQPETDARSQASGPDASLEGIVVTAPRYVADSDASATKTPTSLLETPQSVTVINRDQIDLLNERNVGEAVRYTAGVDGEIFGDDPRYDWLTVRGFYPVEYIDGLQAPVGSVSNVGVDLFGFNTLEILKGPVSTLYGLAPPGGIVNLTSRRPQDRFAGEMQASGGSFGDKQLAGDVTGPIADGLAYRLTGLYRDTGTEEDDVYDRRYYIAPALSWRATAHDKLTLLAYFQRDKLMNNGGGFLPAYGTLLNNPDGMIPRSENLGQRGYNDFVREQFGVGYDFVHTFGHGLSFEQNLKYFGNSNSSLSIYGAGLATNPDGSLNYGAVNRNNFPFVEHIRSFNVDNRLTGRFDLGPLHNVALLGLDYRAYRIDSAFGFASGPQASLADPQVYLTGLTTPALFTYAQENQAQVGLYGQDQAKLGHFVFTAGFRQDWVHTTDLGVRSNDDKLTYRGGVDYLFDNGVAPYVGYATSFQPTPSGSAGMSFKPSTGDQVEGGIKYAPRFLPRAVRSLSTLAIFDLHQDNVVVADPQTPTLQTQIGKVHVAGVELENVTRIGERLSVNFAYSYLFSKASPSQRFGGPSTPASEVGTFNTDPPLAMTPRNKASLLADYTFAQGPLRGFGIGAGVRYTGATFGDTAGEWRDPSFVVWDGIVHYNFARWRLQLNASNLFDKTYVVQCSSFSSCYYGGPRDVTASLTRAF